MTETLRARAYRMLDPSLSGRGPGRVCRMILLGMIAVSMATMVGETVSEWDFAYHDVFEALEIVVVSVFTIEYAARLWSCVENPAHAGISRGLVRFRYATSFYGIVDLVSVLPFYAGRLWPLNPQLIRYLRILRLLKLARYTHAIEMFARVVNNQRLPLLHAFVIAMLVFLFASSTIYMLEAAAQPKEFGSIPRAMWWTIVTMTTVGYGDLVPITAFGRIFAGFVALSGIGMLALPTGILATGFI